MTWHYSYGTRILQKYHTLWSVARMKMRSYKACTINDLLYIYSINNKRYKDNYSENYLDYKDNYNVLKSIFIELRYRNGLKSSKLMKQIEKDLKEIPGKANITRPYFRMSTGGLAQLASDNKNNYTIITDIYIELYKRNTPEAIHLKGKIEERIDCLLGEKPTTVPVQLHLLNDKKEKTAYKDIPVQLNLLK